jgi:hypothetical protein
MFGKSHPDKKKALRKHGIVCLSIQKKKLKRCMNFQQIIMEFYAKPSIPPIFDQTK